MVTSSSSSRTGKATIVNNNGGPAPPASTTGSMNHQSGISSSGVASANSSSPFATPNMMTAAIGGSSNGSKTSFPHPNRMTNHQKTKQSHHTPLASSSSGIKHNVVPVVSSSSSSSSNSNAVSIYLDALQVLNEETMLRACSLLLAPITLNDDDDDDDDKVDEKMDVTTMNESKNSVEADNLEKNVTNGMEYKDSKHDENGHGSLHPPQSIDSDINVMSSTVTGKESSTLQKGKGKQPVCSELEQLQQIYEQCRQAAITLEKETAILPQQQPQQQQQRQPKMLPQLPLPTNSSSLSSTSIVPGMISGRTKIVGRDGTMNRNNGVAIRTGSMKRPLPAVSSTSTTAQPQQQQSIHPLNSKGLFGSMMASNSSSSNNNGQHRRQRLERERSDSSMSTATATSTTTATTNVGTTGKKSRLTTSDPHSINGTTTPDETSVPPPNARQFLAMLNNSDSNKTKTTISQTSASSSRRKSSIDSSTKKMVVNATTNDEDPIEATTPTTSNVVAVDQGQKSPEKQASTHGAASTSPPSTRIQPPRASRK